MPLLQRQSGAFRSVLGGVAIGDHLITSTVAYTSARTGGATIIDSVPLSIPSQLVNWELLSVSFTGYLAMTSAYGFFGRLPKIIAGVMTDVDNTVGVPGLVFGQSVPGQNPGFIQPMIALPLDQSLTVPLWDPTVNELPPQISNQLSF